MTRRRWLALAVAGVAFLLLAGRLIAALWVDHAWFAALGAESLWADLLLHTIAARGGAWLLATLFAFANLYGVRRSVVSVVLPRRVGDLEIGEEVPPRVLTGAAVTAAAVLGATLAIAAPGGQELLTAIHGMPFGESDPTFGYDLGFFVYWLPFEQAAYEWALACCVVVIASVLLLYALTPSLRWERGRLRATGYVRRHLTVLGAVVLAMLAWSHRLDAFYLLVKGSGAAGAFTYADRHINVSTDLLLSLVTFSAAMAVVVAGWAGQVRLAFGIVTAVLVASLLMRQALPPLADRLTDSSSSAIRDAPYRATRAAFTRRAYAVDRIGRGRPPDLTGRADLARGISAWDPVPLRLALERGAGSAGVLVGDFAWASDSGVLRALVVTAPRGVPDEPVAEPWRVTEVEATPVIVDGEVAPQPVASVRQAGVAGPVYFHPGALAPLVVDDPRQEIIGTPFTSFGSRLAQAWSQQNFRLLEDARSRSHARMLARRDVRERVHALAPWFVQGSGIFPLTLGDTLWWAVHLYAASSSYPLSEFTVAAGEDVNYFQHAAVALVDAHSGATLLVADADARLDPVARGWVRRYPRMFLDVTRLPEALARRLPVAHDGILAQATEFARVGSRAEQVLGRHVPDLGADSVVGTPSELPVALPAGGHFSTIPVVDMDDRLAGVVVVPGDARLDPAWLPFDDAGLRWSAAVARLRRWSDSTTARGDARAVRGEVRVVPVAGRVALVQPTYRWLPEAAPTLAAVAILDRGVITGLEQPGVLADGGREAPGPVSSARFEAGVVRLYQRMRDALRRGDWRGFGSAFDSLGTITRQRPRAP